jgi:hypothetical protein
MSFQNISSESPNLMKIVDGDIDLSPVIVINESIMRVLKLWNASFKRYRKKCLFLEEDQLVIFLTNYQFIYDI